MTLGAILFSSHASAFGVACCHFARGWAFEPLAYELLSLYRSAVLLGCLEYNRPGLARRSMSVSRPYGWGRQWLWRSQFRGKRHSGPLPSGSTLLRPMPTLAMRPCNTCGGASNWCVGGGYQGTPTNTDVELSCGGTRYALGGRDRSSFDRHGAPPTTGVCGLNGVVPSDDREFRHRYRQAPHAANAVATDLVWLAMLFQGKLGALGWVRSAFG